MIFFPDKSAIFADGLMLYRTPVSPTRSAASGSHTGLRQVSLSVASKIIAVIIESSQFEWVIFNEFVIFLLI